MTKPEIFSVVMKSEAEIEREAELKRAYQRGFEAGSRDAEKVKQAAIMGCRSLVFNRVTKGECPFGGDCGRCFLCDNAGGCIVITEEARRTDVKAAINGALDELGNILNNRIAKMEVLDSRNPTPFRKGVIEAYRDIEKWELQKRRQQSGEQQREEP